jgi:hypothetical protein
MRRPRLTLATVRHLYEAGQREGDRRLTCCTCSEPLVAHALLVDVHGDTRINLTLAPVSSGFSCHQRGGGDMLWTCRAYRLAVGAGAVAAATI